MIYYIGSTFYIKRIEIYMNTKGKNISEARKNAGLTMEELGKMVGVSRATITRYESGEIANIPDDKIEKIAKATKVSEAFLMGWDTLKKENAAFHARILKDAELQELIKDFLMLDKTDQELIKNMIQSLTRK